MKTALRIRRIDCYLNQNPFRMAFVSLHTERRSASGVLLRLETDTGTVGWGESTPRVYVSGETCEGVIALIEQRFADKVFAARLESLAHLEVLLDDLEARTRVPEPVAATSALGAMDLALWDLWGQVQATPVHRFFVSEPLPLPPLSLSVPILPPEQLRRFHPLAVGMGVSRFKLVLSADLKENLARLSMLRDLVGQGAVITIDANGKLTPDEVADMLPELRPYGITALEQPAEKSDLSGLLAARNAIDLPITLDESVCTLQEAQRAIELGLCDAINLKISKCGGLHATRKLHQTIQQSGIACQLGSHVGESPVLAAAGQTAARILPELRFMEIGSTLLAPCPALQSTPPGGPTEHHGLGLTFSTSAVEAQFGPPVLTLHA